MRHVYTVLAAVIGGTIAANVSPPGADAGSLPAVSAPAAVPALIEPAGYWKRRWRRNGYGPEIVVPDAEANVDVDAGDDVDVELDAPVIVVLPPPRPLSCGEYRYWNGTACVDARYTTPYLGPR
jgi:hypothetical protein